MLDGTSGEGMKIRFERKPPIGEVRDGAAFGFVVAVRLVRIMVLWIALYFVDRAFQESYVQRVLVEDRRKPPRLWTIAAAALAIEGVVLLLLSAILFLLHSRFKTAENAFVIDGPLLRRLGADYAVTTGIILSLGTAMGVVSADPKNFRYRDDGMRGIRAMCTMLLLVAVAVLLVPVI